MKASIISKSLVIVGLLSFSILGCMGQNDRPGQLAGTWIKSTEMGSVTFTIGEDQKWQVEFTGDDQAEVWGSYKISGTQVTFTDEGGAYTSDSSGIYEFEAGDKSVTFNKVDDPVDGRSMMVQGTWARSGGKGTE